ncbi:MAG: hypothetical protein ACPGJS_08430 [Flammeovirgaceae bacterium]
MQLFEVAEIAKFTPEQVRSYEDSLKYYRDLKNALDTAFEEGLETGYTEIVLNMYQQGHSLDAIAQLTGLSIHKVHDILNLSNE